LRGIVALDADAAADLSLELPFWQRGSIPSHTGLLGSHTLLVTPV
jgi:hypothetical protein